MRVLLTEILVDVRESSAADVVLAYLTGKIANLWILQVFFLVAANHGVVELIVL